MIVSWRALGVLLGGRDGRKLEGLTGGALDLAALLVDAVEKELYVPALALTQIGQVYGLGIQILHVLEAEVLVHNSVLHFRSTILIAQTYIKLIRFFAVIAIRKDFLLF